MSLSLSRIRSSWFNNQDSSSSSGSPGSSSDSLAEEEPNPMVVAQNDLTLTQRMISAGSGSILTAFILTPLDVIRIRMQQQEILPDRQCCSKHANEAKAKTLTNLTNSNARSITRSGISTASGAVANGVATLQNTAAVAADSPHLFWVDKGFCKTAPNCTRIDSTVQGFVTIARHEGLPTLWRGMSLMLFMAIPANVIYFTGYEYIRDNSPISGSFNSLLCGSAARLLAATSIAPIELIKTRLQSIPSSKSDKGVFKNVIQDSFNQVKTNGLISLFKGLQITLWRDVPFSGIYWSVYEISKKEFSSILGADFSGSLTNNKTNSSNDSKVFLTSFLSGSLAGTISAVLTHPFDVGKTRLQISQDNAHNQPTMFKFLHNIYRNEGTSALFGGLAPRVFKIAPACAIMISSYEITKMFFKDR